MLKDDEGGHFLAVEAAEEVAVETGEEDFFNGKGSSKREDKEDLTFDDVT